MFKNGFGKSFNLKAKPQWFVSPEVCIFHHSRKDLVREQQTCECGGHCQTTANSCVGISAAASKEVPCWRMWLSLPRKSERKRGTKEEISCWTKGGLRQWKNANHGRQLLSHKQPWAPPTTTCRPSNLLSSYYFGKEFPQSWLIFLQLWGFLWLNDQQVSKKAVAEISQTQWARLTSVAVTVVSLDGSFLNQGAVLENKS